jgi:hypothetical protein
MSLLRRSALPSVLLLLALAACNEIVGGSGGDALHRDHLAAARAQWLSRGPTSYSYVLDLACPCVPTLDRQQVFVTVRNGVSTSAYGDGGPVHAGYADYTSVPKLFTVVENAIGRRRNWLQVGYDTAFGYPGAMHTVFTDGTQVTFVISDFAPLTP